MKISFLFRSKNFWLFIACLMLVLFKAYAVISNDGMDRFKLFMNGLEGFIFLFWAMMYGRRVYLAIKNLKTDG